MAVADLLPGRGSQTQIDKTIEARLKRGKNRTKQGDTKRTECQKFVRGDQYVYATQQGLRSQATTSDYATRSGKPPWLPRMVRNLLADVVWRERSAATSKVPNYEVDPSTPSPENASAARLAGKVLRYGYDKWSIRKAVAIVVKNAIVADEGFAWPHWDSSVGPYIDDGEDGVIGQGEIKIDTFTRSQVGWEPGLAFEDSRWFYVERAMTPESVSEFDGYFGGKLKADANPEGGDGDSSTANLVMVTEYLERPNPAYPQGRWVTLANAKQIVPEREYPCADQDGNVLDEPVLHRLCYSEDDGDQAQGLVRHLLDPQRTINECNNLMVLWMRLALNPQVIIRNGEFKQRLTAEPGAVFHANGQADPQWREVPQIPGELMEMKEEARTDMARISAQNDIPSNISSNQAIQSLLSSDQSRRDEFLANLAEWHSRLGRHCLYLVQRHYTEPRLLPIKGSGPQDTPDYIPDFIGRNLLGEANVTVYSASLGSRTREQITTTVMAYADRGWITGEKAMSAIEAGTAEGLIDSFAEDEGRANLLIRRIKAGTLYSEPPRPLMPGEMPVIDPTTGQPFPDQSVPGWMPRPFDDPKVQAHVFETWMKTVEWDELTDEQKQQSMLILTALRNLDAQNEQAAAVAQASQAQALGAANAARPPQIGQPSLPGISANGGSGPSAGTPS